MGKEGKFRNECAEEVGFGEWSLVINLEMCFRENFFVSVLEL